MFGGPNDIRNKVVEAAEMDDNDGRSRSYYYDSLRRLRKNKVALVCLGYIILFILVAIFAPFVAPYGYNDIDLANRLSGSSAQYLLGTDDFGRCILSRIIFGARISLTVGIVAVAITTTIGVILGSLAGYFGGWVDMLVSRLIEIFISFPDLLFVAGVMFVLGPGIVNLFVAMGVLGWTFTARLVRAQVLQIKEKEYMEAGRASGAGSYWLIMKHVIPNCVSTIIIIMSMGIPGAILTEASLSFLGLGVQPPGPSWGSMINHARIHLRTHPTFSIWPGVAIVITTLAFNIFGDALRDALDPRLKE